MVADEVADPFEDDPIMQQWLDVQAILVHEEAVLERIKQHGTHRRVLHVVGDDIANSPYRVIEK